MLPSAPTTTGMTLMFLMFHILLISLFSSCYLSIFCFSFSLILMYPGIAISVMAQPHLVLFNIAISGFPALISFTLDHNIPQNLHFFNFINTFCSMFIQFFISFQVVFPTHFRISRCSVFCRDLKSQVLNQK